MCVPPEGLLHMSPLRPPTHVPQASGVCATPGPREGGTVKGSGLGRRSAENMAAAKRAIPHFTYVEECDVTALEEMREQLNHGRGRKPKLTMLPLLISAICKTLPNDPMLNASYDDEAGVVARAGAVATGSAPQKPVGPDAPGGHADGGGHRRR